MFLDILIYVNRTYWLVSLYPLLPTPFSKKCLSHILFYCSTLSLTKAINVTRIVNYVLQPVRFSSSDTTEDTQSCFPRIVLCCITLGRHLMNFLSIRSFLRALGFTMFLILGLFLLHFYTAMYLSPTYISWSLHLAYLCMLMLSRSILWPRPRCL